MCYCHNLNPLLGHTVDDDEGKTLHEVTTRAKQVACPQFWRMLDSTCSILQLFLKCVGGLLAALGVPNIRFDRIHGGLDGQRAED